MYIFSMSVSANNYNQSGVIENETNLGIIIISGQEYLVDHQTKVNSIVQQGELGPVIPKGTPIGFNSKQLRNETRPFITDIWLLNE